MLHTRDNLVYIVYLLKFSPEDIGYDSIATPTVYFTPRHDRRHYKGDRKGGEATLP